MLYFITLYHINIDHFSRASMKILWFGKKHFLLDQLNNLCVLLYDVVNKNFALVTQIVV